jgi:hypothetical protein
MEGEMRVPLGVLFLLGAATSAVAMIPPHVNEISPKNGAKDVPVDTEIRVELETAQDDPGLHLFEVGTQTEVPVKTVRIDRWRHEASPLNPMPGSLRQGASCVFKPVKPLKPRTRYKTRCGVGSASEASLPWLQGCEGTFTTGVAKPSPPAATTRRP